MTRHGELWYFFYLFYICYHNSFDCCPLLPVTKVSLSCVYFPCIGHRWSTVLLPSVLDFVTLYYPWFLVKTIAMLRRFQVCTSPERSLVWSPISFLVRLLTLLTLSVKQIDWSKLKDLRTVFTLVVEEISVSVTGKVEMLSSVTRNSDCFSSTNFVVSWEPYNVDFRYSVYNNRGIRPTFLSDSPGDSILLVYRKPNMSINKLGTTV